MKANSDIKIEMQNRKARQAFTRKNKKPAAGVVYGIYKSGIVKSIERNPLKHTIKKQIITKAIADIYNMEHEDISNFHQTTKRLLIKKGSLDQGKLKF